MTRLLVCGGRDFSDAVHLYKTLDTLNDTFGFTTLIEGGAKGADRFAREWAVLRGLPTIETYEADWDQFRDAAGPIRNRTMLRVGKPNFVVAFKGGAGTANMVSLTMGAILRGADIQFIRA